MLHEGLKLFINVEKGLIYRPDFQSSKNIDGLSTSIILVATSCYFRAAYLY